MPQQIIGKIPDFTSNEQQEEEISESSTQQNEEVKQSDSQLESEEETETLSVPPTEEQPAAVSEETDRDDTGLLSKQIQGLQEERVKLLKEIQELRGKKREFKQEELVKMDKQIDELKDMHSEDVTLIERVLRAKGYVTKEEANKMFYEAVKQEELNTFLDKYPEYKSENDPEDRNWTLLQRELSYYKMPENPHQINEVLEKAHRSIMKVSSDRSIAAKKRQIEIAGVGAKGSGAQRSSSYKSLPAHYLEELRRGGWSEEEIKDIERSL